jgi:hypothetical protein
MTNFGFITGCSVLALGIWLAGFYINRALQSAGYRIASAIEKKQSRS